MTDGSSATRPVAAVICNPVKTDVAALRAAVDAEAECNGWAHSLWFETTSADPGQNATTQALTANADVLIVAGGDGTIRAVAEAAYGRGTPLGVVPAGTGNLLARNLSLPLGDLELSVRTAFTGISKLIDVGLVDFTREDGTTDRHVFVVMAGIGLDASMAANTNSQLKRRLGWLAYTDPIAKSVFANKQITMRYRLDDGHPRTIHAHTVIVGNCSTLTANILLLPDAKLDDGRLDVVVLSPKGFGGWAHIGSRLALGGVLHRTTGGRLALQLAPTLRALRYTQTRTLHVDFDTPQGVELDGDDFGPVTSASIAVQAGALSIRVPHAAPAQGIGSTKHELSDIAEPTPPAP
ncbi:diacylglycerol/lipid kinase family protein [Rathayibacter soli]|uniref:diacylglycerol/lipid kinase family protein n=1 Tax=Rathayibacter soli TaxID=3144168 RepID=UPI0027E58BBD|nr:diacylglycerol kinase family protein [Glaciibacter superstes]